MYSEYKDKKQNITKKIRLNFSWSLLLHSKNYRQTKIYRQTHTSIDIHNDKNQNEGTWEFSDENYDVDNSS